MSQLGKIFLWVAVAGALVSAILGYLKIQAFDTQKVVLVQTQADVTAEKAKVKTANDKADAAVTAQAQVQTQLDESKTKVTGLQGQLDDATKKQTDLQADVANAQADTKKAQDELTRVQGVLKDQAPEEVMAKVDKLSQQIAADNSLLKISQDQLQAASQQVAQLKDEINKSTHGGQMPPGVSGKITFVNPAWNFVVINVGLANGVVPNGELIVYSGREFVAKVKVTSAEDNTAVADILPGGTKTIQVGDDVIN